MEVHFFDFAKRENSTKQPMGTYTNVNVTLKEPTSITDPIILISGNHFTDYIYCQIPSFGNRYYFVTDTMTVANNLTQLKLKEDYLGSHKSVVGNTRAHIAYSSTGYNVHINDMRMAVKNTKEIYRATAASGFDNTSGYYVVGILNDVEVSTGAVCYYFLSSYNFQKLLMNLTDTTILANIRNIFNDPMDSIVSCAWLPITSTNWAQAVGSLSERVKIGSLTCGVDGGTYEVVGWRVTTPIIELQTPEGYASATLTFPFRYQDFRDNQPYTSGSIYLPGVGLTDINVNDFYESTGILINTKYDVTTGDIIYWIADADSGTVLKTLSFNCAVEVPLAQVTTNGKGGLAAIGGTATGAVTALVGYGTGNVAAGSAGAVAMLNGASNAAMSFNQRSTSIKGSNNGRGDFVRTDFELVLVVMDTEDIDDTNYIALMGRPVGETNLISSHSGYVQCEEAAVAGKMLDAERTALNGYINSGFYYE